MKAQQSEKKEYGFSRTIDAAFDEVVERTRETLKQEGFGVLSEIRIDEKLKEKLGVDFRRYVILGACNPALAHKALQLEDKVGTMLPCNVIVQEIAGGGTEIAAIDPVASMMAIDNPRLKQAAEEVRTKLRKAIEGLQ